MSSDLLRKNSETLVQYVVNSVSICSAHLSEACSVCLPHRLSFEKVCLHGRRGWGVVGSWREEGRELREGREGDRMAREVRWGVVMGCVMGWQGGSPALQRTSVGVRSIAKDL